VSAGRILVVDDEPQIRRIMRTALTGAGYEVDDAKTGEEALEKLRDYHPDLVLLDMNMPGMGGLAACREIRAGTGVGIIMLTVRNTEADKVEALDAGADDFVNKPFSTPELLARIRAALRRVPASAQSSPARIRVGKLVIDFAGRTAFNGVRTSHLTPRSWIWCAISPATPMKPWPTASFCKRFGGPTTAIRWTTCACSSAICERRSNPIPTIPNSSPPSPGSATASTARSNHSDPRR
jgi:CheY-like chemotaxis protein